MIEPETRNEEPQRRPNASLWLLAVILAFVGLSIYGAASGAGSIRHTSARQIKVSDTDLDDQSVQDLVSVDLQVKGAFISSLVDGKPRKKDLSDALKAAVDLNRETHNAPFSARRLIIIRALSGVDPTERTPTGDLPLEAFSSNLPAAYTPTERAMYLREETIWAEAFVPSKLTPARAAQLAAEIRRLPNLKWWRYPGIYAVFMRAGDVASAKKAAADAATNSMTSLLIAMGLMLLKLAMLLAGIVLLIVLVAVAVNNYRARTRPATVLEAGYSGSPSAWAPQQMPPPLTAYGQPGTAAIPGMPYSALPQQPSTIWKTEPEAIPVSERKLTSNDLFAVFLLYLVFSAALGVLFTGFPGVGTSHSLKFSGLLTPFLHQINKMSTANRMLLAVSLEALLYVVGGGVPIAWLIFLARKRGASLSREIGLTRRFEPKQILYGVGGYCIGMPLMMAVALLAPKVFRHFPSPSNPAIPQLISANSVVAGIVLIVLASFAAPIVEETLFRGVLYNAIKLRLGVWPGIVLSAFVFGFIHPVGVAEMFPLAVLGGVFAWMAETRKSLVPSMVAHCLNNLTSSLLLFSLMQQ